MHIETFFNIKWIVKKLQMRFKLAPSKNGKQYEKKTTYREYGSGIFHSKKVGHFVLKFLYLVIFLLFYYTCVKIHIFIRLYRFHILKHKLYKFHRLDVYLCGYRIIGIHAINNNLLYKITKSRNFS